MRRGLCRDRAAGDERVRFPRDGCPRIGEYGVVNPTAVPAHPTEQARPRLLDAERCYRAVRSRDRRFDGVFYVAVRTTGIYCRPSCPAVTPRRGNVEFHVTAAAAQQAGYRACRRCLPDATPGSPEWDLRADVTGRAMRLISDGVVERDGVHGLAARLGYTSRHLTRLLTQEVGAGPLALARARRAQTARVLIETTGMAFADVAFAAGFSSVRQFNDTVREVYAATPSALRQGARRSAPANGVLHLRLPVREPFDGTAVLRFLSRRAVPGVERVDAGVYSRSLRLPHGHAHVALEPTPTVVHARLSVRDLRDVTAAVERCRRLFDLDADPRAVSGALGADAVIGPLVRARPGLRVPGHVDGTEVAVRAVLGQQVSVAGARTLAARLVDEYGEPLEPAVDGVARAFPSAERLADADPAALPMPRSRGRAVVALCAAITDGTLALDRSADRDAVRDALLMLPGVGRWTAGYIAMRALGDPDVMLDSDLGVRRACAGLGVDPDAVAGLARRWRPWRSYALMHLLTPARETR
jgi:AraC family transcriptional regulator, regulatory protein of adaptative response / DNA-3-methyladenine glycosylase II